MICRSRWCPARTCSLLDPTVRASRRSSDAWARCGTFRRYCDFERKSKNKEAAKKEGKKERSHIIFSQLTFSLFLQGTITKPNSGNRGLCGEVFYLPQKPYSVIGTLREQITYPLKAAEATNALSDDRLVELLKLVDLGYLVTGETKVRFGT